jgi:hypothetical protein
MSGSDMLDCDLLSGLREPDAELQNTGPEPAIETRVLDRPTSTMFAGEAELGASAEMGVRGCGRRVAYARVERSPLTRRSTNRHPESCDVELPRARGR